MLLISYSPSRPSRVWLIRTRDCYYAEGEITCCLWKTSSQLKRTLHHPSSTSGKGGRECEAGICRHPL